MQIAPDWTAQKGMLAMVVVDWLAEHTPLLPSWNPLAHWLQTNAELTERQLAGKARQRPAAPT